MLVSCEGRSLVPGMCNNGYVPLSQLGNIVMTTKTTLVSSDIKFIRRDQKQRRNGKACRANPT